MKCSTIFTENRKFFQNSVLIKTVWGITSQFVALFFIIATGLESFLSLVYCLVVWMQWKLALQSLQCRPLPITILVPRQVVYHCIMFSNEILWNENIYGDFGKMKTCFVTQNPNCFCTVLTCDPAEKRGLQAHALLAGGWQEAHDGVKLCKHMPQSWCTCPCKMWTVQ